jgi:hypothetical protein
LSLKFPVAAASSSKEKVRAVAATWWWSLCVSAWGDGVGFLLVPRQVKQFETLKASMAQGWCVYEEAGCNLYPHDINIYFL